jgi:hypothetical protein
MTNQRDIGKNLKKERLHEQFVDLVRRDFHYLEKQYGFKIKSIDVPFIIYESNRVHVRFYYDPAREEFDLGFGLLSSKDPMKRNYGLFALKLLKEPDKSKQSLHRHFQSTQAELLEAVHDLAEYLSGFSALLSGDEKAYKYLDTEVEVREREIVTKQKDEDR